MSDTSIQPNGRVNQPDTKAVRQFFEILRDGATDQLYQSVVTFEPGERGRLYSFSYRSGNLDQLVEIVKTQAELGRNVYAGTGLLEKHPEQGRRGKSDDVVAVRAMRSDIDYASGEAHSKDKLPPDEEAARSIIDAFPLKPTMVVNSGHGLQPWWLFREPAILESPKEREEYEKLTKQFEYTLSQIAVEKGYDEIDTVADLARILRVPGVYNRKPNCEPVIATLVEVNEDARYTPDDLGIYLREMPVLVSPEDSAVEVEMAAKVVADHMPPQGDRHYYALYLCGLLRGQTGERLSSEKIFEILDRGWTLAGMPRTGDRQGLRNPLSTTDDKIERSEPVAGGGKLEELTPGAAIALGRVLDFNPFKDAVDALMCELAERPKMSLLLDHAGLFAKLSEPNYLAAKTRVNEILGKRFKARDFSAAVKAERTIHRRRREEALRIARGLGGKDGLPLVWLDADKYTENTTATIAGMHKVNGDNPIFYNRGGEVAGTVVNEDGKPEIRRYNHVALAGDLDRNITFMQRAETGTGPTEVIVSPPPGTIVADILTSATDAFPPLKGISEIPLLRPDGTICDRPGYDKVIGVIYRPPEGLKVPKVPERPTEEDVTAAKELIKDILGDFPYENEASRTNAVALLLTPILREAIKGNVPFCLVDKPEAGTGGSLLAEAVSNVAVGRFETGGAPENEEEFRKYITSNLDEGTRIITLDNLEGRLKSGTLSRAITSQVWQDRRLGSTEIINVPNRAVFIGTGNNVAVGGDLPRRTYPIRMNAEMAKPWTRDPASFKIQNLSKYTREHRGEIAAAALTLARSWYVAGCPEVETERMGSFEEWARIMGGTLAHAGYEGFLANLGEFYEQASSDADEWETFFAAWLKVFKDEQPITLERFAEVYYDENLSDSELLREALPTFIGKAAEQRSSLKRVLGQTFGQRLKGRRFGPDGLYIISQHDRRKKIKKWAVLTNALTTPEQVAEKYCMDERGTAQSKGVTTRNTDKWRTEMY
jgi:hypothetical protein